MVSDSELIERLREFLSTSDLNTTTNSIVRRRLEEDFGIDLSERKVFIREQVDAYMQSQFQNEENEEEDGIKEESIEPEEEEEDEGGEEEEGEGESSTKKRKKGEVKKRGGGGGFTKVCSLSPELQEFTGVPEMARTEVVKQLWSYIKQHNLQDPSNKRNILCDDALHNIFRVKKIDMFQMNKALTKHIWPVESDSAEPQRSAPKEKQQKQDKEEAASRRPAAKAKQRKQDKDDDDDEPKRKEKRQKGGNSGSSGLNAPLKLSDALVKFLGTGESELPRSAVVKRMWDYIKQNELQDPADKRQILCDEKLKELFNVETFTGFAVAKYLTAHFIKPEQ